MTTRLEEDVLKMAELFEGRSSWLLLTLHRDKQLLQNHWEETGLWRRKVEAHARPI